MICLKELELSGIITRTNIVSITGYGKKLFDQIQHKDDELEVELKHYRMLNTVEQNPKKSTTFLISQHSGSPNEMIDLLRYLEKKGYIRIITQKLGKGRPKKVYELTETGKQARRLIAKLLEDGERK